MRTFHALPVIVRLRHHVLVSNKEHFDIIERLLFQQENVIRKIGPIVEHQLVVDRLQFGMLETLAARRTEVPCKTRVNTYK